MHFRCERSKNQSFNRDLYSESFLSMQFSISLTSIDFSNNKRRRGRSETSLHWRLSWNELQRGWKREREGSLKGGITTSTRKSLKVIVGVNAWHLKYPSNDLIQIHPSLIFAVDKMRQNIKSLISWVSVRTTPAKVFLNLNDYPNRDSAQSLTEKFQWTLQWSQLVESEFSVSEHPESERRFKARVIKHDKPSAPTNSSVSNGTEK